MCGNFSVLFARVVQPKIAIHAIASDKVLFAFKHEAREAAALVSLNDLDLQ